MLQSRTTSGKPTIFLSGKSPWTTAGFPTHFHSHFFSDLYDVLTVLCRILSVLDLHIVTPPVLELWTVIRTEQVLRSTLYST